MNGETIPGLPGVSYGDLILNFPTDEERDAERQLAMEREAEEAVATMLLDAEAERRNEAWWGGGRYDRFLDDPRSY